MPHELIIRPIAHIRTDFPEKFGIPRQAGIAAELQGEIVFEPEYRMEEALRGLEEFSHIWLIWGFSENEGHDWSPTVRPPRLVRLLSLRRDPTLGTTLLVAGADMVDGTPIYDIKPYLPYADSVSDASGGFAPDAGRRLQVVFPPELLEAVPEEKREALLSVLAHDPRPRYQHDPERVYGMAFAGLEIRFRADDAVLTVVGVEK